MEQTNLQPLLEYFGLLRKNEDKGYLEVLGDKHEAYITLPALLVIAGVDAADVETGAGLTRVFDEIRHCAQRIRAYAWWRSQAKDYLAQPFALHVVKTDEPHDLLCTVLLSYRRVWWKLWLGKADKVEVISYL